MAPVPWIFFPAVARMISWPYRRIITPCTASCGYFAATARMLRCDAGAPNALDAVPSVPNRKSGLERWKKWRAWLWNICP
jgi:hypothetical protein